MAKSSDEYTIWYEGYREIADELEHIGESIEGCHNDIREAVTFVREYHAVYHQLRKSVVGNLDYASQFSLLSYERLAQDLPKALRMIADTCEEREKAAMNKCRWDGTMVGAFAGEYAHAGTADDFYKEAAAKAEAEAEAQRQAEEAEKKRLEEEEAAKAKEQEMLGLLASLSPTAAQEYADRLTEAHFQELMDYYKDDPEMLAKIKADYEAWKKSKAQAAKGIDGLEGASDGYGSDYGSDYGSGYGSDYGGSDWSSDYGSDLGSDWASSDWASDLLDEGVDSEDYWSADSELDGIMGSTLEDAVASGAEAAGDAADVAEPGMFDEFGANLASVVQSYGLQAALAIGGGVALYATREQTIEAAAHVAEFVSTKCKPAVNDVMEQVRGMAKKTKVNLSNAKNNMKAAVRGEKAGDLVG